MQVNDLYIDYLQRDPDSPAALAQLPSLLSIAKRYGDVVHYLSPQRFARLYQHTPSLRLVTQIADEGVAAARALGRIGDQVRFLLQRGVVDEIAHSNIRVSEVRARAAVNDVESAMAMANGATRPEERLRLLSAIARVQRGRGLPEDPDLTAQLRALFAQIDPKVYGPKLPEVATDLFATAPELAIEMVSSIGEEGGENAIDWALLRLSIEARASSDERLTEHARAISERIQSPAARKLSMEAAVILGRMSAESAIQEAEKLDATGDKLYVLQHWMQANRADAEALHVFEYGIRLALQATGYTATAQTFRELALCLPYIEGWHKLSYYIGILDAQQDVLRRTGPAEDYFRLQLLIARAEFKHDKVAAQKRYSDIYNEASVLADLSIRTAVMARLSASLTRVDPGRVLEAESLHTLADQELAQGVDLLLSLAADHFEATRGVLRALALARPGAALAVAAKLNTERRRDRAYQEFVETASVAPTSEWQVDYIAESLERIVDHAIFTETTTELVSGIRRRKLNLSDAKRLLPWIDHIKRIDGAEARARASAYFLSALAEAKAVAAPQSDEAIEEAVQELVALMESAWDALDADAEKLELGLDVVTLTARSTPSVAHSFVDRVNALKHNLVLPDAESGLTAFLQLQLASRALEGMVTRGFDRPELSDCFGA
jgi:hypothetical protein